MLVRPLARFSFSVVLMLALFTAGCGGSDAANIELRVVSDLVPELEVGTATAVLYEGVATANNAGLGSVERNVVSGEPLARGLWLATFERVPHGTYTVWTTLRRENGEVLGRQPITFVVSADASYTVTITADCVGVECPGGGNAGFLACIAGVCVDPRCSQTTPEFCPSEEDLFCDAEDNDCVPQMPCGVATCESGVCLQVPSASECGEDEFCSALSGCTAEERPPEAPEDPPGPCGDACAILEQPCTYAFVVCENATGCTPFANRPEGSPCPNEGVCNAEGECIEGLRGDAGVVDAGVGDMDVATDGGVLFDMSVTSDGDVAFDMTTASDASALDASFDMSVATDTGVAIDMTTAIDTSVPVDMTADMGSTPCAAGYRGTVETGCVEINECAEELDTCDALTTCTNTAGSYTCSACPAGYVGAGRTGCTEINECLYNACDRRTTCTNTPGSFTCSACPSGFSGTGKTGCDDIDECDMDACDSLTECTNTVGSFRCTACPEGYTGDGKTGCDDIDECALGIDTCSDVDDEVCMNGPGAYGCVKRRATVAAGYSHSCALADGGVQCWGANDFGQLGDGTTTARSWAASTQSLGAAAVSVVGGGRTNCALLVDGGVKCWGANYSGQIGDGTTATRTGPTAVTLGSAAVAIGTSNRHSCALLSDGSVKCWGANGNGQFGPTFDSSTRTSPVVVPFDGPVLTIAVSDESTCAILRSGALRCYGTASANTAEAPAVSVALQTSVLHAVFADGTLRHVSGTTTTRLDLGERRARAAYGGLNHSCVVLDDGTSRCWGQNHEGQLGIGSTTSKTVPTAVNSLDGVVRDFGLGDRHSCVRLASGDVKCWGYNYDDQLGYRWLATKVTAPTQTSTLGASASDIAAGDFHSCVVLANGRVRCWGSNGSGQIGDGTTTLRRLPTAVASLGADALSVSAGSTHSCAVLTDGRMRCWGSNGNGQLGVGSTVSSTTPVTVQLGDATVVAGASGVLHSCALLDDGSVRCWGANNYGQLGDGTTTQATSPVTVALAGPATHITLGWNHSCALLDDGNIQCWGYNTMGQLGDGTTTDRLSPENVSLGGEVATAIATGANHSCAIVSGGDVLCWGRGDLGAIGSLGAWPTPTPVALSLGGHSATSLGLGTDHSCFALDDGTIRCVGINLSGELGNGTLSSTRTPTATRSLGGSATQVTAGTSHSCALLDDGTVRCWGLNSAGQLGNGATGRLLSPIEEAVEL